MRVVLLSAAVLVSSIAGVAGLSEPQSPGSFTNLRVLPKDISRADLVSIMRQFCFDLDLRCESCHVGEGNDLSKFDFASDAKPAKATARRMLTMVAAINDEHLKGLGEASAPPKVTCYTCHRGALKPLSKAPG